MVSCGQMCTQLTTCYCLKVLFSRCLEQLTFIRSLFQTGRKGLSRRIRVQRRGTQGHRGNAWSTTDWELDIYSGEGGKSMEVRVQSEDRGLASYFNREDFAS